MELRAIEHAVAISGALARSPPALRSLPDPGQPIVFSARVEKSSHRWFSTCQRSECGSSEPIDQHGPAGGPR